jgi:hypothetical protein
VSFKHTVLPLKRGGEIDLPDEVFHKAYNAGGFPVYLIIVKEEMEYVDEALVIPVLIFVFGLLLACIMYAKKCTQGTCGGLASIGIEKSCDCEAICAENRVL